MADKRLIDLEPVSEVSNSDLGFISQNGVEKKTDISNFRTGALGFHLGTLDESGAESGLADGFGVFAITNQSRKGSSNILFKENLNLSNEFSYDELTGNLILPKGQWLMCASLRILNKTLPSGGSNQNNVRCLSTMSIKYGQKIRHSNTKYLRFSSQSSLGDINNLSADETAEWVKYQGFNSIAGSVISDGRSAMSILFQYISQGSGGTLEITHAHIHGFKQ